MSKSPRQCLIVVEMQFLAQFSWFIPHAECSVNESPHPDCTKEEWRNAWSRIGVGLTKLWKFKYLRFCGVCTPKNGEKMPKKRADTVKSSTRSDALVSSPARRRRKIYEGWGLRLRRAGLDTSVSISSSFGSFRRAMGLLLFVLQ